MKVPSFQHTACHDDNKATWTDLTVSAGAVFQERGRRLNLFISSMVRGGKREVLYAVHQIVS